jgi:hypothetical protein
MKMKEFQTAVTYEASGYVTVTAKNARDTHTRIREALAK